MEYSEAIEWLRTNNVTKDDGSFYEFGEDIPEGLERKMTDAIGEPIMLCRFPVEIKSFYMKRDPTGLFDFCLWIDRRLTESLDLLMPGFGEIVGASIRITELDELLAGYERSGIDPSPYYWFDVCFLMIGLLINASMTLVNMAGLDLELSGFLRG
jgi:asparaginyl-tRNA synthetase